MAHAVDRRGRFDRVLGVVFLLPAALLAAAPRVASASGPACRVQARDSGGLDGPRASPDTRARCVDEQLEPRTDSPKQPPMTGRAPAMTPPDWTFGGWEAGGLLGYAVASAGDVNGDGYADVVVGAHQYDSPSHSNAGWALVFHGSPAGLGASFDWSLWGDQAYGAFGRSVASAGDVNGDGYDDVIIGAWLQSAGQTNEGRAYVFHGSPAGLVWPPAWIGEGDQISAYFGSSVASAGDVNGDGHADVIVGAYGYSNPQSNEGRAFVYHGSPAGLSTTPAWTAEGNQPSAIFGYGVASAGDVNGDGYDDVIVGAYRYTGSLLEEGRAYVYHGSPSGLSATPAWTALGGIANGWFGTSVASAGDVNADGYADVLVAAGNQRSAVGRGRVYLYYGSAAGLSATPGWSAGNDGTWESFGGAVASAGDFNADGVADVLVGAPDSLGGTTGGFLVYYGARAGLSPAANWTEAAVGDHGLGGALAAAGDVNGDGVGDLVVGAPFGADVNGKAVAYHGFRVVKGDLDGDRRTDLLLRNVASGQLDLWVMDGLQRTQLATVTPTPDSLDWQVAAVDDFDGDRRNDLALWHAGTKQVEFWRMDGATRLGPPVPLGAAAPLPVRWRLAAAADFDADRRPDLLFADTLTGEMIVWTVAGMSKTGEIAPSPLMPVHSNWVVVAARDFNGDFWPDLLFYNGTSGRTVLWLMDGQVQRLTSFFTNPMGPGSNAWRAVAAGDYGPGPWGLANTSDIVWRNATSGRLVVWFLDDAGNRTAGLFTDPAEPAPNPTDWIVTGPR